MAIQDSDRFLIDDAGVSKKIRADKLKGGLDATYANMKLLVNKPDYSSRFIYCKDLQSNLPDDHWLMVERSSVSYKVNGTDVHSYFPSGPAGATGVITDSHTTPIVQGETGTHDLTVASLATPNFVDNESIRMVSAAGETSSYVPVTNTITNVFANEGGYARNFVNGGYCHNHPFSPSSSYTISAFCTISDNRAGAILGVNKNSPTHQSSWIFFPGENYVQQYNYNANVLAGVWIRFGCNISLNEEFHFLAVHDGTAPKVYINGVELSVIENTLADEPGNTDAFITGNSSWSKIGNGGHQNITETFPGAMRYLAFVSNQTLAASVFANGAYPKSTTSVLAAVGNFGSTGFFYPLDDSVADATIDISPDGRGNSTSVVEPLPLVEVGSTFVELTFADPSPDVKFFQPGDVVQGREKLVGSTTPYSNNGTSDPNILGDGTTPPIVALSSGGGGGPDNNDRYLGHAYGGDSDIIVFDPPITSSSSIFAYHVAQNSAGDVVLNQTIGTKVTISAEKSNQNSVGWQYVDTGVSAIYDLQLTGATKNSDVIQGLQFFSTTNDDSGRITFNTNPFKIISRDPVARTMVVDGGSWLGSDGSNSGDLGWDQSRDWVGTTSTTQGTPLVGKDIEAMYSGIISNVDGPGKYYESNSNPSRIEFNPPITANHKIEMYIGAYTAGTPMRFKINDIASSAVTDLPGEGEGPYLYDLGVTSLSSISWETGPGTSNPRIANPVIDGKSAVDPNYDDTPEPNSETIVTGPSKSGTAKTDGVPASTTFRIKDSNGQWVDNTNSNSGADHSGGSAQNFYVKNASGRVALARLDP